MNVGRANRRLIISTADAGRGGLGRSNDGFEEASVSLAADNNILTKPQSETLRHHHQVQARQVRARRVIHYRRVK